LSPLLVADLGRLSISTVTGLETTQERTMHGYPDEPKDKRLAELMLKAYEKFTVNITSVQVQCTAE
jgi:hypothetical protein